MTPIQRKGGRKGGHKEQSDATVEPGRVNAANLSDHDSELEILTRHLRETQNLLEESRDRYADLYDYAPLGYAILTTHGVIRECNMTLAQMVGTKQRHLDGVPFATLLASKDQFPTFLDHLARSRKGHERVVSELLLKRRDGSQFDVEISSVPFIDYRSRTALYRTAVMDISERKEAQRALQRAKDELEVRVEERTRELERTYRSLTSETEQRLQASEELRQKEQMLMQQSRQAAMGEMIGNIAHQWRQPLNTLGLMFQSLPLEYEMGTFSRENLDGMVGQAMQVINHMSQTIDAFRNFFKPDKAWVAFDLRQSLQTSLAMIEAGLKEKQIRVELQCRQELVAGGYPNEFSQAVLNILMNARDALIGNRSSDPAITIHLFEEQGRSVVTIADNGGGIPEEIIGRIFDPYFTTKGSEKGTGIGLFMSKMIIERNMRGRLTARNLGGGAEFRIELTRVDPTEGEGPGPG